MTHEKDRNRHEAQTEQARPAKKAYVKPVLRHLGTVRELTQSTLSTDGK